MLDGRFSSRLRACTASCLCRSSSVHRS
jgi:hypothetical protein